MSEPETFTVVSKNQRVKFYVEKHHDSPNLTPMSENAELKNVDKLTSLFQLDNSNGKNSRNFCFVYLRKLIEEENQS